MTRDQVGAVATAARSPTSLLCVDSVGLDAGPIDKMGPEPLLWGSRSALARNHPRSCSRVVPTAPVVERHRAAKRLPARARLADSGGPGQRLWPSAAGKEFTRRDIDRGAYAPRTPCHAFLLGPGRPAALHPYHGQLSGCRGRAMARREVEWAGDDAALASSRQPPRPASTSRRPSSDYLAGATEPALPQAQDDPYSRSVLRTDTSRKSGIARQTEGPRASLASKLRPPPESSARARTSHPPPTADVGDGGHLPPHEATFAWAVGAVALRIRGTPGANGPGRVRRILHRIARAAFGLGRDHPECSLCCGRLVPLCGACGAGLRATGTDRAPQCQVAPTTRAVSALPPHITVHPSTRRQEIAECRRRVRSDT